MQIVLMVSSDSGQASFPAESIEGLSAPQRHYDIVNGQIVLSGYEDAILHHDADELLKQSIYRMPTPAEQEAMTQAQQQASQVQENAPVINGTEQGNAPLDPNEPPAVDNGKKKANGG